MNAECHKGILGDFVYYANDRIAVSSLDCNHYFSTENMLPNRGGVCQAASLPEQEKTIRVEPRDVLISNIRPYFKKIWLAKELAGCSNDVLCLRAKQKCLPEFLFYCLSSDLFFNYVMAGAKGTKMPRGDKQQILQYPMTVPDLATQRQVISILSGFDEKITLNASINQNLEAQTQAIFKSWFVDFEPFRNGRFVESELGHIPAGWRVANVYDIASVVYGAPFASNRFSSNKIGKPIIRIRDLTTELPQVYTDEIHPKGYVVKPGDIIVGMDGEFRAYIWGGEEAWLNQRVCVFKPQEDFSSAFVRYSIMPLLAAVESSEVATTVIHLGKNDIDKFKIIIPDQMTLKKFNGITTHLYSHIVQNKKESRYLAALRDTLLPKLMSGEIDVSEVDI